jgi:Spy/CpxP family protein refolding chaperone
MASRWHVVLVLAVFSIGSTVLGGDAPRKKGVPPRPAWSACPAEKFAQPPGTVLPGYWMLSQENVQKDLKLTDEQKKSLKQIADKYYAQMREEWSGIRELAPGEQQKKFGEIREASVKLAEGVRKQVEEVLTPEQLAELKELTFRYRVAMMLVNPRTLEELGASDEQKAKFQQIRDDQQKRMQEIQQQSVDKMFKVLTAEQIEKLKEKGEQTPF